MMRSPGIQDGLESTGVTPLVGKNFECDVWYVGNRSLIPNLRIICSTVLIVVMRSGINEAGQSIMSEFKGSATVQFDHGEKSNQQPHSQASLI